MRRSRRGATTIEMTLVGLPMIFLLVSTFEIARGMWMYHTLAYAVRNGVRYAAVRGINCVNTSSDPNTCSVTLATVASVVQSAAVGMDPTQTMLTFKLGNPTVVSQTLQCYLMASQKPQPYGSHSVCSTHNNSPVDIWPVSDNTGTYDGVGKAIEIDIETPFYTSLSMFWPGTAPVKFALTNFYASSMDYVQF